MKHFLFSIACVCISLSSNAGPGHDHGESAFAQGENTIGHFQLSGQQIANLDIQSAKAKFLPLSDTISMLAFTELLPERRASVSTNFEGTLLRIAIKVGEEVKKGQLLAVAKPINIGSKEVAFRSPIDGYVLELNADLGEVLPIGGDIMQIGDPSQMLVRGVAYETPEINLLKIGQPVEIHLDIAPSRHIDGNVQRINRVIDPISRTFSVYALIDTPDGDIQPGLQATMEVFAGDNSPVLGIPKSALLGELGSYFVYVIEGNEVSKRGVTIGTKTSHHIEIKNGLLPNERVVTKGNYQLQYISIGGVSQHDHADHKDTLGTGDTLNQGHTHDQDHEHEHDDHSHSNHH